jgi:hypothetical protein
LIDSGIFQLSFFKNMVDEFILQGKIFILDEIKNKALNFVVEALKN